MNMGPVVIVVVVYYAIVILAFVIPISLLTFFTTKTVLMSFKTEGLKNRFLLHWLFPAFCSLVALIAVPYMMSLWLDPESVVMLVKDMWVYFLIIIILETILLIKVFLRRSFEKRADSVDLEQSIAQ